MNYTPEEYYNRKSKSESSAIASVCLALLFIIVIVSAIVQILK